MDINPINLRCNYLVDPLGIDDRAPRFSWELETDGRDVLQSAYQLQVRSPAGELLWDSGKVGSLRSAQIPYGGPALISAERYYWRVRVWDHNSSPSFWSKEAWFEMGLLDAEDWAAHWIGLAGDDSTAGFKPCPYLRREFTVREGLVMARLYITAHGLYELSLNGQSVTPDLFTPGCTPYDLRLQVQTYDLMGQLTSGANLLGVILGDGWYRGQTGVANARNVYGTQLGLLAQLALWYEDGSTELVASDRSWRARTGPILKADLKDGEIYDARLELDGWDLPGASDDGWQPAEELDLPLGSLAASPGVPVRAHECFTPTVLHTPDGNTVLDFGQNIAGVVTFAVDAQPGTEVVLTHGEALDADGNFTLDHLSFGKTKLLQEVRYICRGNGREVHTPRFTVHGFRYVLVSGWQTAVRAEDFTAHAIYSDMPSAGSFSCSNEALNQLYRNTLWSMKGNFLDIPTDCPTRERAGWTGDAQIFVRTGSYLMETAAFFSKWLCDLALEQRADGMVSNLVPNPNRRARKRSMFDQLEGSAGWGDAAVIIPWELYRLYGDTRLLAEQYPSMVAWVEYMRTNAAKIPWYSRLNPLRWFSAAEREHAKYIWEVGYHWGEWLEAGKSVGPQVGLGIIKRLLFGEPAVATAYLAYSAGLLAEAARVLGHDDDARRYGVLAAKVREAYTARFIDKNGRMHPDTQASYVRALAFNLCPAAMRPKLVMQLVRLIRAADTHLGTGFLSTPFLLSVLSENGHLPLAYELLQQTSMPSWLYAVEKGATTIWESWEGIDAAGNPHGSLNHYSYGAVVRWLVEAVAGIALVGASGQQLSIRPQPGGGLTWAKGSYHTLYGEVAVSWELAEGEMRMEVTIPHNTRAAVHLPFSSEAGEVRVGERRLDEFAAEGAVHHTDSGLALDLGSGRYQFSYPVPHADPSSSNA
ncbi:MAG: family 78 glycoside hydrolase catalytic domain [Chloroflexi bacterium]|nr:family 78 glycoside hydrolase catalytic domain [Chloroflexota bacterium]